MSSLASPYVDARFGPGDSMYIKTRADVPADAVWHALRDFSAERPSWWPLLTPSLYRVHDAGERSAEVTEGSKLGPGFKVWARERYDWDDAARELRSTILESNLFAAGGTARYKVTPDGEGCYLEEWYERKRVGLVGRLMTRMAPRIFPRMIASARAKTFAALAQRRPERAP